MDVPPISNLLGALPGSVSQGLIWGLMAIGVFITYKILDVPDLTVDGSFATGGAMCAILLTNGVNVWLALLCALAAGLLAGALTGFFHTFCGIPAILAGILTQLGLWSINLQIMGMANVALNVNNMKLLVSSRFLQEVPKGMRPVWQYPILLVGLFAVVVILALYWFFGTERGCALRATGANPNMARAQGINTNANKVLGLMLSNGLVALSGALLAQYQGFADVKMGIGSIVIGLAAVIIGEGIFGKLFHNFALRLLGVVLGAIIYYVVLQVVLWLRLDPNLLKLFSALVVALFLAVPYWKGKYFSKPSKKGAKAHA